jgi:putative nucleotidyltransferase with HDIG domain
MRRILFVDDEARILEGLQRMLRPQRQNWEMAFASSGEAALKLLEEAPFDVIVSDMRMPRMDGVALLTQVRDRFPGVVRMVLTGHASFGSALRAVPVAHQFLLKPCDPKLLQVTVERACHLKELLGGDLILRTVGGMRELPPLPRTYAALVEAFSGPEAGLDRIVRIVEHDVAVSARILQLVNSALFGLTQHVSTIHTAVSHLGFDVIKNLVLSVEIFQALSAATEIGGFRSESIHDHSYLTACIAARLSVEKCLIQGAMVAALLHDVGKLIVMKRLPEQFAKIVQLAREQGRVIFDVEREAMGVTHAEIGAYLLGLWGFPFPIVEAVAYHHNPGQVPHRTFDCLAAVHVADVLAHTVAPRQGNGDFAPPSFDMQYLESLGVANQIAGWDSTATEVAGAQGGKLT